MALIIGRYEVRMKSLDAFYKFLIALGGAIRKYGEGKEKVEVILVSPKIRMVGGIIVNSDSFSVRFIIVPPEELREKIYSILEEIEKSEDKVEEMLRLASLYFGRDWEHIYEELRLNPTYLEVMNIIKHLFRGRKVIEIEAESYSVQ